MQRECLRENLPARQSVLSKKNIHRLPDPDIFKLLALDAL